MSDDEKILEEVYEQIIENYQLLNNHLETELFRQRKLVKEQEKDSFLYHFHIFIYMHLSVAFFDFKARIKNKKANRTVKRDSSFNCSNPSKYCPCIGAAQRR